MALFAKLYKNGNNLVSVGGNKLHCKTFESLIHKFISLKETHADIFRNKCVHVRYVVTFEGDVKSSRLVTIAFQSEYLSSYGSEHLLR